MSGSWEPFGRARNEEAAAHAAERAPARPDGPPPGGRAAPRRARPASAGLSALPARGLAVVTCMDCRIDPLAALGLGLGDAVVIRTAGSRVSDGVVADLRLAAGALAVTAVRLVAHTDCAAYEQDDARAREAVLEGARRVRAALPQLTVRAELLDLTTGAVQPADQPWPTRGALLP